jgi:ribonucleoside-diphosphate reductase alpha chain|nr:MAG TPA: terminase large subunit [Caudoviricetes sp.]
MSSTFSEQGFAKEYMSRFVGSSDDAWFDYEKLLTHRRIVNPETHEIVRSDIESFYILSVDVARKGCQTACTVLKVFPGGEKYTCNIVNVYVLGKTEDEKVFDRQVIELKRLIKRFNPREVVLDINGIGVGFADFMIKESLDPVTGEVLPAYGFIPDHDFGYEDIQPRNCPKIIYGIKATG